jgi:hypothetical protein
LAVLQEKDFTSDRATVVEFGDRREGPNPPIKSSSGSKVLESLRPGERMSRVFQLLATFYAVAMLVITLRVYMGTHQHPGLVVFFVACTASFYIICYNALSIEVGFKAWLEQHYPTLRSLSMAVAAVLTMVPLGVLYLAQAKDATNPTVPLAVKAPLVANAPVQTAAPVEAKKAPAGEIRKSDQPVSANSDQIAVLRDVRYSSGPASTTVTIDLDEAASYDINRLTEPDRIYLDLRGSKLDPGFLGTRQQVTDSFLRAIRVAEHEGHSTRVTLVTNRFCGYSVTQAANSHQLLVELRNPTAKN